MRDELWISPTGTLTVRTVDDDGTPVEPKPELFAGKGDHDHNGKVGGAAPPIPPIRPAKKRRR